MDNPPLIRAIKEFKKTKPEGFTAMDLKEKFEEWEVWDNPRESIKEMSLLNQLVSPMTRTYIKEDAYVVKNLKAITVYRWYMFIEANFDFYVGITGTEGKGKSSLAMYFSHELQKLGVKFDLEHNTFFRGTNPETIVKKINEDRKSLLWFDEAKAFFDKRESLSSQRVRLLQDITAQRQNNNIVMLCLGAYDELDVYFRDRRLREIIIVIDKGVFMPFFNTSILGMGEDKFYLDYFKKSLREINLMGAKKDFDYNRQIETLLMLPSSLGVGTFPRIIGTKWEKYKELKREFNTRMLQEEMKKRQRKRQAKRRSGKFAEIMEAIIKNEQKGLGNFTD